MVSSGVKTEIESLRNGNYSSLADNSTINFSSSLPANLPDPSSGSVAITTPMAGLKRVDVTVTYTDHGSQHKVELTSLIGVIGISQ